MQKNNNQAINIYKKAIKINDQYPQIHHNLGNAYLEINKIDLAEESFKTAVSMNNNFFPSYKSLISIYIKKKEYQKSLPLIKKLMKISPNDLQINIVYINMLYKTKSIKEANKRLNNLKTIYKNDKQATYLINKTFQNNTQN